VGSGLTGDGHSEVLNRLPNALGGRFAVGKLSHRFDARQTVPNFKQPFVVVANRIGELFLGREDGAVGSLGFPAGSVEGDVVFFVDREVFHGVCPCAASAAVITFITRVEGTSKRIPREFGTPRASTRLRAADCVFRHVKPAIEMEQIEDRIAALEQAKEVAKSPGKY
jgi:hypothetical protein